MALFSLQDYSPKTAAGRLAAEYFHSGLYCAESILASAAEFLGVHSPLIPSIATGFCSGMSRTAGNCGVLSGGIMAVSLTLGRSSGAESTELCYEVAAHYRKLFLKRFDVDNCWGILDLNLGKAEDRASFAEKKLKDKVCIPLTTAGTDLLMEVFAEYGITEPMRQPQARANP